MTKQIHREIIHDKENDTLKVSLTIPLTQTGEYTYGEGRWQMPAVCVYINERHHEFGLFETQYLDYKDSLQATAPIVHFESEKEALKAAHDFGLPVEYAPVGA